MGRRDGSRSRVAVGVGVEIEPGRARGKGNERTTRADDSKQIDAILV